MISIIRNKRSIKIEEVWFADRKSNDKKVDIISYCQTQNSFGYLDRQAKTLVNKLTVSEEKILNDIHKDYRYEIRRAQREGVKTSIFYSSDITDSMIEVFSDSYLEFMQEKNLYFSGDKKTLTSYLKLFYEKGNLAITTASVGDKIIVYHVYVHDNVVTRLLYSVSHYRNDLMTSKSLVGMSNRLLHYNDMLAFKASGLQIYDWGGISEEDGLHNISDFKKKFGGTQIDTYYIQEAVSFKGNIALIVKRLLKFKRGNKEGTGKNSE